MKTPHSDAKRSNHPDRAKPEKRTGHVGARGSFARPGPRGLQTMAKCEAMFPIDTSSPSIPSGNMPASSGGKESGDNGANPRRCGMSDARGLYSGGNQSVARTTSRRRCAGTWPRRSTSHDGCKSDHPRRRLRRSPAQGKAAGRPLFYRNEDGRGQRLRVVYFANPRHGQRNNKECRARCRMRSDSQDADRHVAPRIGALPGPRPIPRRSRYRRRRSRLWRGKHAAPAELAPGARVGRHERRQILESVSAASRR